MTKEQYFDWLEHKWQEELSNKGDIIMAYRDGMVIRRSQQLKELKERKGPFYDNILRIQEEFKNDKETRLWDE